VRVVVVVVVVVVGESGSSSSSSSSSSFSGSRPLPLKFGAKLLRLCKGFTYLINGTKIHVSAINMLISETLR